MLSKLLNNGGLPQRSVEPGLKKKKILSSLKKKK